MPTLHLNDGGIWRKPNNVYANLGGAWTAVQSVWENNGGTWIKHWPEDLIVPFSPSTGYSLGSVNISTLNDAPLQLNTSNGAGVNHMTSISSTIIGHRSQRKNDNTNYTTSSHTLGAGASTVNGAAVGGRTGGQVWSGTASVGVAYRSSVESQTLYVPTTHVLQGISITVAIRNDDNNHSSYTESYYSFKILTAPLQRGDGTPITANEITYGGEVGSGGGNTFGMGYNWDAARTTTATVPDGHTARSVEFGFFSQDWNTGSYLYIKSRPTTVTITL